VEYYRGRKADKDYPPVAAEKDEGEECAPSDLLSGNEPLHSPGERKKEEIKRPDAKDATDIKSLEINVAARGSLAYEKFGDEIGAEKEKELDAIGSGSRQTGQQRCENVANAQMRIERRIVGKGMVNEDQKEREETKDVEFGLIEALGKRAAGELG